MSPAPILGELTDTVNNSIGVMQSAEVALNGVADKIKAAVEQALANGATEAELKPLIDLETALENESGKLAQAVANNP